jgi:hypothetical protein
VKMTVRSAAYVHAGEGEESMSVEEREREMERTRVAFVREVEVLRVSFNFLYFLLFSFLRYFPFFCVLLSGTFLSAWVEERERETQSATKI